MQINQRLDSKKRHLLMSNSIRSYKSNSSLITCSNAQNLVKEFKEFYSSRSMETLRIRMMTKRQLSSYLRKINSNKAVQIARKIKDRREFNRYVGKDIKRMLSNYMFAYHRKLLLSK